MTRRTILSIAFVLLAAMPSCRRDNSPISEPQKERKPAIVSLTPNLTEMLSAIGAEEYLVGRSQFCDYPKSVKHLPPIPGGVHPDLESILVLDPTLVVLHEGLLETTPKELFEEAGVQVFSARVETAQDVADTLDKLTVAIFGSTNEGDFAHEFRRKLDTWAPKRVHRRVLMIHGHRPLIAAGPGSWGDELIRFCGLDNALQSSQQVYPVLDAEQLVSLAPDFVVDTTFAEGTETLDTFWQPMVQAGAVGKVLYLNDQSLLRPGPRLFDAVDILLANFHQLDPEIPANADFGDGNP